MHNIFYALIQSIEHIEWYSDGCIAKRWQSTGRAHHRCTHWERERHISWHFLCLQCAHSTPKLLIQSVHQWVVFPMVRFGLNVENVELSNSVSDFTSTTLSKRKTSYLPILSHLCHYLWFGAALSDALTVALTKDGVAITSAIAIAIGSTIAALNRQTDNTVAISVFHISDVSFNICLH